MAAWTPARKQTLRELAAQGRTPTQIAEQLGTSAGRVVQMLAGPDPRDPPPAAAALRPDQIALIRAMANNGLSQRAIAIRLGLGASRVRRAVMSHHVTVTTDTELDRRIKHRTATIIEHAEQTYTDSLERRRAG
jgi:DNA-binding NarL/FixJ family response regulator